MPHATAPAATAYAAASVPAVAGRAPLTRAQLHAAWLQCRRPAWPPTLDEALADPVLSRLVAITALHPPPAQPGPVRQVVTTAPGPLPGERATHWRPATTPAPAAGAIDRKRAAAGDRDDD